jgi:NCK-associated protein 1
MARALTATQHKLAERLTILNDRALGMLTRMYNIKKMLGNPESKPPFFSDKSLEPVIKAIVKKFPSIDTKSNSSHVSAISAIKDDVIKSLQLYYYTFVDIMDLKDHITDLLTTMDASQVHFDITLNYDLTKGYLDLIVTYIAVMILLSRVDDRKAVLGLFNFAFELQNGGKPEESFPRLGQLVVDYDPPIKKLADEFIPHAKCVTSALMSIKDVYLKRRGKAEEWRAAQFLSLLTDSSKIVAESIPITTVPCDYLSVDAMERWIIVGLTLCHQSLGGTAPELSELWRQALLNGYVMTLCRDEVLLLHPFIINYFEGLKGFVILIAVLSS